MTETTQPDPQVARAYPEGWHQGFVQTGSEADGTARVCFVERESAEEEAETAQRLTGARMEVISDGYDWAYRPAAHLTPADIPAGQEPDPGSAVRDRNGEVWALTDGRWRVAGSTGETTWPELLEAGAPLTLLVDGPVIM